MDTETVSSDMGLCGTLFVVLAVLKVLRIVSFSWLWVFVIPIIVPIMLSLALTLVAFITATIVAFFKMGDK